MTTNQLDMIQSTQLRERIAAISNLPTLPETYSQLMTELSKSDVAMSRVGQIVSRDVAISAKLLQVVNSALFGLRTPVENVVQALNLLGLETVKSIVLAAGAYHLEMDSKIRGYLPSDIYSRAVDVGTKSRFIAYSFGLKRQEIEDALTAGLLHDVGKLVLLTHFVKEFEESLRKSKDESISLHRAQEQVIGADDAVVGAYLLSTWGLPSPIIDAVVQHYSPSKFGSPTLNANAAVHLAWASEHDRHLKKGDPVPSAFDREFTDALGITNQLGSFVGMAPEAIANSR